MKQLHVTLKQRGVALIVVLTIFALVATLAAAILYRQSHFRQRTANLLNWDVRYRFALSVETVAIQGLQMDLNADKKQNQIFDSCRHEQWAIQLPPTPYEHALISASVQDLQARFNLNWVVHAGGNGFVQDKKGIAMLQKLLEQLLVDPAKAQRLAYEMADWIDTNNLVDGVYGAEDSSYRHRRTPNIPIADASEMRSLLSMTNKDIPGQTFWQYVTALPLPSTLNINNASSIVLKAVVGDDAAKAIITKRQEEPFTSIDDVMALDAFAALTDDEANRLSKRLSVNSSYFEIMTDVAMNDQYTRLISRLQRPAQGLTAVYSRQLVPRMGPLESACRPGYSANNDDKSGTR